MNIVAFLAELPDSAVSDVRGYIALYNFPTSRMMPAVHDSDMDDWPHRAATYFRQSLNSLSAPDAAVMVAGSAVDAMLKAKGYESGSVYDRIG